MCEATMYGETARPEIGEIHTITLKFGERCNFKCRHCCQAGEREQVSENLALNPDVIAYIGGKAEKYYAKTKSNLRLRLWGGEPLVYLKNIKEIVSLTKDFPVKYFFTTNGSLLTEDVVDYVNREGIRVSLSNDGSLTEKVRGANVLEDERLRRLFNKIESRSVTLVLTPYSQDLLAAWEYIHEKTGAETFINVEFLMATEEMPKDLCAFDVPAFERTMEEVAQTAFAQLMGGRNGAALDFLRIFTINAALALQNRIADRRMLECRQIYETVNLDLRGNIYPCHNFGEKLGDIYLPHPDLISLYNQKHRAAKPNAECRACDVFPFCRGHCPFIGESANKKNCCDIRRVFFRQIAKFIEKCAEVLQC
jgi:uncharacterized protein